MATSSLSRRDELVAATLGSLRSLGRSGVADLVDGCCDVARRFAERLDKLEGIEVVNDVVLNQVLVRVGDLDLPNRLEHALQEDGVLDRWDVLA